MSVEAFVGWHGQGKTICAVRIACERYLGLRAIQRDRGGPMPELWSNAAILGARRFDTWDELMVLMDAAATGNRRCLVVIDEAGLWLSSRFFAKLDPRVMRLLQERRKVGGGLDLIYTAPNFDHVDKLLRDVTQVVWAVRRHGGTEYSHDEGKPPRWFSLRAFDPSEVNRAKGKPKGRRVIPFSRHLASLYTTGLVDMEKPMADDVAARPDFYADVDRHEPRDVHLEVGVTVGDGSSSRRRRKRGAS